MLNSKTICRGNTEESPLIVNEIGRKAKWFIAIATVQKRTSLLKNDGLTLDVCKGWMKRLSSLMQEFR